MQHLWPRPWPRPHSYVASALASYHLASASTSASLFPGLITSLTVHIYSVSQKNPPWGFLKIFPKRLGIIYQFFYTPIMLSFIH